MSGNPVEITVEKGDPVVVELSYAVTAAIDDGSVGLAKLADLAASRLIGRGSAGGTGVPQAITIGSGLSMTGTVLATTGGGMSVNVYEYDASTGGGNRTPTANTRYWIVEGCGGGARGSDGGTTSGGSGGAAGMYTCLVIPSAQFASGSVSITVGAGGTEWAQFAGTSEIRRVSDGVILWQAQGAKADVALSSFGSSASWGSGGLGGTGTAGVAGRQGAYGSGGGGAGQGLTGAGHAGGSARQFNMTASNTAGQGGGAAGGAINGGAGAAGAVHASGFGSGGGGGGQFSAGAGGAGGAGIRGSGGGGGGRGTSGGAGGNGGAGFIRIIEVVGT